MGVEPERLRPGNPGGGLAAAGKILLLFLPQHEAAGGRSLEEQYPALYQRAIAIEDNAMPHLIKVRGLGRSYAWKERYGKE